MAATEVVEIEYSRLEAGENLSGELTKAYGDGALGILVVRNVPGAAERRRELLPLARALARLPSESLESLVRPEALYCFGWSHGKEKFKGAPDLAKGSFYANPLFDDPSDGDHEAQAKYPHAASSNTWPKDLPELEGAFKAMGRLLCGVAKLILKQCDTMVASQAGYTTALYKTTFETSKMVAGRLLHYFPMNEACEGSWCGWHNDNSCITGLVPALWVNDDTGEEVPAPTTSESGLYIQSRSGNVAKVSLPADSLAFQVGEAAQILSGGALRATPHHVRGHKSKPGELRLSRETFACFFEPQWDAHIGPPEGAELAGIFRDEETDLIPPLSKRFRPDPATKTVEFGQLLGDSFKEYYKHTGAAGE